jgi:hypothetical protein
MYCVIKHRQEQESDDFFKIDELLQAQNATELLQEGLLILSF